MGIRGSERSDSARDSPVQDVVGGQGRPCEAAFGGPWKAVAAHREGEGAGAGLPTELVARGVLTARNMV